MFSQILGTFVSVDLIIIDAVNVTKVFFCNICLESSVPLSSQK